MAKQKKNESSKFVSRLQGEPATKENVELVVQPPPQGSKGSSGFRV